MWNEVDPVYDQLASLATSILVNTLNSEIIETAAAEGIAFAESELGPEVADIPPEVVARPTTAETENLAPTEPAVVSFFGPAVFALVIQHLAVTLTALSLVRERLSGQLDRFRVAPVTSTELLLGKYVAYGVLSLALAGVVGGLLVGVLGVPLLGGWLPFVGIVLALTFASLGVGLLFSLVADSERQAVQLSMILLLASVFFSGFVLPVTDFADWARYLAYALPVTHGIALLQEVMLRGEILQAWMIGALVAIGLVLYAGSLIRLRRIMRRAD
jgi:ABC-2 type transport system permease protein